MIERLVLASNNEGKLREFRRLLAPHRIEVVAQSELGVPEADEPHPTFVENALAKARYAALATGLPALADDSGLVVDALGGAPGVRSARYAGADADDAANIACLLHEAEGLEGAARSCHFVCVIVLLRSAHDPMPLIAQGIWHGRLLRLPRGKGGFGYDPVFLDASRGRSAAELTTQQKHAISHRGQALAQLRAQLSVRGVFSGL